MLSSEVGMKNPPFLGAGLGNLLTPVGELSFLIMAIKQERWHGNGRIVLVLI